MIDLNDCSGVKEENLFNLAYIYIYFFMLL